MENFSSRKKEQKTDITLLDLEMENIEENFSKTKIKKTQKSNKTIQKDNEKIKKYHFNKILEDDKFSKNVIKTRKIILKEKKKLEKRDCKILNTCDKNLLKNNQYKEIVSKINEFNKNGKNTIVYFSDAFFPTIDGVITVLDNYAVRMKKYYNVVICAPKHKGECFKTDKYFVLYCNSIYFKTQGYDLAFPQLDFLFIKFLSMLKIDLIHVHSPFNLGTFGISLAKKRNVPCISTFHSQFKRDFYNVVKSELFAQILTKIIIGVFQKSTVTLTMNEFSRKILNSYGVNRQIDIIPNATNLLKKQFYKNQEDEILKKYKINKEKFNLLFIGRFVEVKNVFFILKILKELKNITNDFNMIFIGFGPEYQKMIKFVKENNLTNNIIFTGKIDNEDEKAIIIKNSNLLLFPSLYDTDGIVKIECACYSVPTICIKNTGVSSVIKNNVNGFVEKEDQKAFANKIFELIKNKEFVKSVGEKARESIYLTWDEVSEKVHTLYEKLLKKKQFKNSKKNIKKRNKMINKKI